MKEGGECKKTKEFLNSSVLQDGNKNKAEQTDKIPEQQCVARWENFAQVEIFWEQSRHLQVIIMLILQIICIDSNLGSDI